MVENSREWHTGGVCIDMNGMFEREKRITGGSEKNIIRKSSKLYREV